MILKVYKLYMHLPFYCRLAMTRVTNSLEMVGRSQSTILDEVTAQALNLMLECLAINYKYSLGTAVTVYFKALHNHSFLFSKCAESTSKRNSFTVIYTDPSHPQQVSYGCVERFIACATGSPIHLHVAVIKPIDVGPCEVLQKLNHPSEMQEIQNLLASDYVSIVNEVWL